MRAEGKRVKDYSNKALSLSVFLQKYCTNLVDLNLYYDCKTLVHSDRLDGFFQIKSLKRMKIEENSTSVVEYSTYVPAKIPACSNLELLHLNIRLIGDSTKKLLQASYDEAPLVVRWN